MIQAPASREIYRGSQTIVTGILAVTGFRVWMTLNQMACRLASHPGCSAQAMTHDMIAIEPRCLLMGEKPINTVRSSHVSELFASDSAWCDPRRTSRVRRSEERRVGKECVSTCRSRGSPEQ